MPVSRDSRKKAAKQESLSSFLESIEKDHPEIDDDRFSYLTEAEEDEEENDEDVDDTEVDDTEGEEDLDLGDDEEGEEEEAPEDEDGAEDEEDLEGDEEEPEGETVDFDANVVGKSIKGTPLSGKLGEMQQVFKIKRSFADREVVDFVKDVQERVVENNPQLRNITGIMDLVELATKGLIATPTNGGENEEDLEEENYGEENLIGNPGKKQMGETVSGKAVARTLEFIEKKNPAAADKVVQLILDLKGDGGKQDLVTLREIVQIITGAKKDNAKDLVQEAAGTEIAAEVMPILNGVLWVIGLATAAAGGFVIKRVVSGLQDGAKQYKKMRKGRSRRTNESEVGEDDISAKEEEYEDTVMESDDGLPEGELYFVKNDANNQILGVFQDKAKAMNLKAHMNSFMKSSNLPEATKAFIAKSTGKKKMLMDMLKAPQNESEEFEECGPAPHHDFDMGDDGTPKVVIKVEKEKE